MSLDELVKQALRDFRETFARVMLRVYSFPVPTLAALGGHAIAGGAIFAFACDLRFAINSHYRIQMNEVAIGLPLPSWMTLVCSSAIPSRWRTEALLQARAYRPQEALDRGILDELVEQGGDVLDRARDEAVELLKLNRLAYAITKKRIRKPDIHRVLELLKGEQTDTFDVLQRSKPQKRSS
jgi:enoyl-CoA hydratase